MRDSQSELTAEVFNNEDGTKNDIIASGERALVCLYKGRSDESVDSLRYSRLCQKITTDFVCTT